MIVICAEAAPVQKAKSRTKPNLDIQAVEFHSEGSLAETRFDGQKLYCDNPVTPEPGETGEHKFLDLGTANYP